MFRHPGLRASSRPSTLQPRRNFRVITLYPGRVWFEPEKGVLLNASHVTAVRLEEFKAGSFIHVEYNNGRNQHTIAQTSDDAEKTYTKIVDALDRPYRSRFLL